MKSVIVDQSIWPTQEHWHDLMPLSPPRKIADKVFDDDALEKAKQKIIDQFKKAAQSEKSIAG